VDVPTIRTARLELVSLSAQVMEALVAGGKTYAGAAIGAPIPDDWPNEHDAESLRLWLGQMHADAELQEWAVRAMVLAGERALVGHIAFHGPPGINVLGRPDAVEFGYTVFPDYRRRGFSAEAARGIFDWASSEHGIRAYVASIAPENAPSVASVLKLGFVHVGEHWDEEDGLEHEYLLELPE
jgi:RimJ/RimL family protein N-acetyltransferase